jgi:protein involved in polysaccharide export with SLBB domain
MQQQGNGAALDQLNGIETGVTSSSMGQTRLPILPKAPDLGAVDAIQRQDTAPSLAQYPKQRIPSQFQRFVQQTTGRLLPNFGQEVFDNRLRLDPNSTAPAPGEYVMGSGDEVRLQLWGTVDFIGTQTIDRNGTINIPKVGAVQLAGIQVKDLEDTLHKQIARVYKNFKVSASLGKLRGISVFVVGQAQRPGTYTLTSLSTLVSAVFASGGPSPTGSMRAIELKRGGKTVATFDLYDLIGRGDKSRDPLLQPGDVVVIPPAGARMAITGATDHAAIFEIKAGETVQDMLSLIGGVPALARPDNAQLERISPSAKAPRQVLQVSLTPNQAPAALQDGDILTLLPITRAFANEVTLQGAVAMPMRHKWFKGMRVQDLVPDRQSLLSPDFYKRKTQLVQNRTADLRAQGLTPEQIQAIERAQQLPLDPDLVSEVIQRDPQFGQTLPSLTSSGSTPPGSNSQVNPSTPDNAQLVQAPAPIKPSEPQSVIDRVRSLTEQINWDTATIERMDPKSLRTTLLSFNLSKAINKDPAHNLELQPGDVITITSSKDLKLPVQQSTRLVSVEGEVANPGIYQVQPGETLTQLIKRIGGFTSQAYVYGTEFTRQSVKKQQQQNLDQLIKRMETLAESNAAMLAANMRAIDSAQAQVLMQQQRYQIRSQIERLRTLKSKGRVSMELEPSDQLNLANLPNIPLEDGDAILVPARPSFVSAVGSVNNENVFIFKYGKTVGDVVKSAGLAQDADETQAFVLRADGSVVSRLGGGLFSSFESRPVMPGDTIIVPPKADRESSYNFWVRGLKDWSQIISNLGVGAAAIKALGY